MIKDLIKQLGNNYKRLIFISHKYKDNPEQNRKDVDKICKYWYRKGYIPISPLHLFSYIDDDSNRETIKIISKILILLCPNFAVYHQSEECQEEEKFAIKHNKNIYRMYPEITKEEIEYLMTHPEDIRL